MKRKLTAILAGIALMLCMPLCTSADTEIDRDEAQRTEAPEAVAEEVNQETADTNANESFEFIYTTQPNDDGTVTATIIGCIGRLNGDLVIPGEIDGYTVTAIGDSAFSSQSDLNGKLVIPKSITSIGDYAFYNCRNLTGSLLLPNGITSIGKFAFGNCSGFTGNLVLPDGVTTIGERAFISCRGLVGSLVIPDSITTIGIDAFGFCSSLNTIVIPANVEKLDQYAFVACSSVHSIYFLGDVPNTWDNEAFLQINTSILTIYYPAGNTSGWTTPAWTGPDGVTYRTSPVEPESVPTANKFGYTIVEHDDHPQTITATVTGYGGEESGDLIIPYKLDGYKVTAIADDAFSGCSGFSENLVLSSTVESIGANAFHDCTGIKKLIVQLSVDFIGNCAFQGCSSLEQVYFFGDVPNVWGNSVFQDVDPTQFTIYYLKNILFGYGLTNWSTPTWNAPDGSVYNTEIFTAGSNPISSDYTYMTTKYSNDFAGADITKYYGEESGDLIIPEQVDGFVVTGIFSETFRNCSGFTGKLVIPDSVTIIDRSAFNGCSGFTGTLRLPDSLTTIGDNAFSGCSSFTGALRIPSQTTSIGSSAFSGCSGFTGDLIIPEGITSIDMWTFYKCSGFDGNLVLPEGLKSIGDQAFFGCSGFTGNLNLPDTVWELGSYAFAGCSGFTGDLVIHEKIISLPNGVFSGCSGFNGNLKLHDRISTINRAAFKGCSGFTGSLVIPDGVQIIDDYSFYSCSGYISIILPKSIYRLGSNTFSGCTSLKRVYFFGDVPSSWYGNVFFGLDTSQFTIYYPAGNTSGWTFPTWKAPDGSVYNTATFEPGIEFISDVFEYKLKSSPDGTVTATITGYIGEESGDLVIPKEVDGYPVTEIGDNAFDFCSGFTGKLVIPDSVIHIGNYAFYRCTGFSGTLTIPDSVTHLGYCSFLGCSGFTGDLTIPDSVTYMGSGVFFDCVGFDGNLKISNRITYVDEETFRNCSGFRGDLIIPAGITYIDFGAFEGCTGFEGSLILPEGITNIENSAFENCTGLTDIVIPTTLGSIRPLAFGNCSSLQHVYFSGNVPNRWVDSMFNNVDTDQFTIYYPAGNTSGWTSPTWASPDGTVYNTATFTPDTEPPQGNYVYTTTTHDDGTITATITGYIGKIAGDLVVPAELDGIRVTEIGKYAFTDCRGFTGGLILPEGITRIDKRAFSGCSGFTGTLNIPKTVTYIGDGAFVHCDGFTGDLYFPDGLTTIDSGAFNCCTGIENIFIPASLKILGSYALSTCTSLQRVYFFGDVPVDWGLYVFISIDESQFTIYYPEGNTSGWTSPTWTAPDGSVYNTSTFVSETETVPGDINGDGVFDYMDISRLYYLYTEDTFEADEALCDYNGDGVFDYYDITKLYADFRKIM